MFRPKFGTCSQCQKERLLVVKKLLCKQCNDKTKRNNRTGRQRLEGDSDRSRENVSNKIEEYTNGCKRNFICRRTLNSNSTTSQRVLKNKSDDNSKTNKRHSDHSGSPGIRRADNISKKRSASKSKLLRRKIPKRSEKRKKQDLAYKALREAYLKTHPECEANIPGVCSGDPAHEIHHTYSGKDREKYYLDTTTWKAIERSCHDWIHAHPLEAREMGLLK